MTNCVDLAKSHTTTLSDGVVTSTSKLVFIEKLIQGLVIFKVRTQLLELFCTQVFVDRVHAAGLNGFVFVPIWPLPEGTTYHEEFIRASKLAEKWKPKEGAELDIKGNAVVLRLYCEKKKPSLKEKAAAEAVMACLEVELYDEGQKDADNYFGNVECHEIFNHEIRISLSTPDADRLVAHILPALRQLPWPGHFHVVKRRGEYYDTGAMEEYVRVC
jgi:hypothetical protein